MKYLYNLINQKYIYYFLFLVIHVGFITLNKKLYSEDDNWVSFLPTFLVHFSLMVIVTCSNGLLLLPWFQKTKNTFTYLVMVIVLIALYTFTKGWYDYHQFALKLSDVANSNYGHFIWSAFLDAIWFVMVSGMLYIAQTQYEKDQRLKNIQIAQLGSELKYLMAQINPHFLFNGLNTIYGLIEKDNLPARNMLVQFSDLLRYNLYEANVKRIDIEREAFYLENYVNMQKARAGNGLKIELCIEIQNNSQKVIPLLFLPFVENAFKFVSYDNEKESYIKISLIQKFNQVLFECENSYEKNDQVNGGIGLENVKRRLELLYPDAHTLQITDRNELWSVNLNLTA